MWNYQEILTELRPSLVVEFGTFQGGSALYFATVLDQLGGDARVLSVDVDHAGVAGAARDHERIELLTSSSADEGVRRAIVERRTARPGPVFAIVDSDHAKDHVRAELELLRTVLVAGDYLVVEDSNVNGHPVLPGWGPGPYEALEEFLAAHPGEFGRDVAREAKFGFTFAPTGFLTRT